MTSNNDRIQLKHWGRYDYLPIWKAMKHFTEQRTYSTPDELWIVEHNPVYTLGQRAIYDDIIHTTHLPLVHTDRGGSVTYHGPGQLVIYPLLNLKRLNWHLRTLVNALENTVIELLLEHQIIAYAEPKAPGIYIKGAKVGSLGIRIHKGCSYHGIAINVDMDLTPFEAIYPCGLKDTPVTQLSDWLNPTTIGNVQEMFLRIFQKKILNQAIINV